MGMCVQSVGFQGIGTSTGKHGEVLTLTLVYVDLMTSYYFVCTFSCCMDCQALVSLLKLISFINGAMKSCFWSSHMYISHQSLSQYDLYKWSQHAVQMFPDIVHCMGGPRCCMLLE